MAMRCSYVFVCELTDESPRESEQAIPRFLVKIWSFFVKSAVTFLILDKKSSFFSCQSLVEISSKTRFFLDIFYFRSPHTLDTSRNFYKFTWFQGKSVNLE